MIERIKNNVNNFFLVRNENFTLISISLCKFLYGFYTAAVGSLLVPIGETFNVGIKIQSIVFPFNYFGQIVIIFFVGYFADRLGKKIVHITSLALLGFFALIFSYAESFYLILFLFLFMGIFGISINTIADASISDSFLKKKGFYLNIAHVFFGLGAMTSPVIFNLILSMTGDFRTIYFILFIISFLILFLISVSRYPSVNDEKIKLAAVMELLRNKRFLYLCVFAFFSMGSQHAVSGWIPTLFQKNLDISQSLSNYSLSVFWLSIVAGRILMAFLSHRFREYFLLRILNFITFFILALSFFLKSYVFLIINYMVFGLLIGGFVPLIIAYSAEIYPRYSTTRVAIIFSFGTTGMLIISTVVGMLGQYFQIYKVIAFTAAAFLAYIFIFYRKMK